jgi:methyltransferase (TIGR00027 family)
MIRAAHLFLDGSPPIFRDDFALALSGCSGEAEGLALLQERYEPVARKFGKEFCEFFQGVLRSAMTVRSRYTEETVEAALQRGLNQYVVLGAGLDSFALRRRDLADRLDVYEVDHPATQQWKRTRIGALGIPLPSNLIFVPVDFEQQTLVDALRSSSYRDDEPAIFSWLGVVMYLTKDAVRKTLRDIAMMATGSEIVTQYSVPPELLDEPHRRYLAGVAAITRAIGEPWINNYTSDELAQELEQQGFDQIEHFGPEEAYARYFAGRSDSLPCQAVHRLIHARVGKSKSY